LCRKNIELIEEGTFEDQHQLTKLEVPYNTLKRLSGDMFFQAKNLEQLSFTVNEISTIESGFFSALTKLQALRLSYNKLTNLPFVIFLNKRWRLYVNLFRVVGMT
jgi:Leucine-rich repeat (LRR) protein